MRKELARYMKENEPTDEVSVAAAELEEQEELYELDSVTMTPQKLADSEASEAARSILDSPSTLQALGLDMDSDEDEVHVVDRLPPSKSKFKSSAMASDADSRTSHKSSSSSSSSNRKAASHRKKRGRSRSVESRSPSPEPIVKPKKKKSRRPRVLTKTKSSGANMDNTILIHNVIGSMSLLIINIHQRSPQESSTDTCQH